MVDNSILTFVIYVNNAVFPVFYHLTAVFYNLLSFDSYVIEMSFVCNRPVQILHWFTLNKHATVL